MNSLKNAFLPAAWGVARRTVVWQVYGLILLWMALYAFVPALREDDVWKTLGTLLIGTAFVNMIVAAYFTANMGNDTPRTPSGTPEDPVSTEEVDDHA